MANPFIIRLIIQAASSVGKSVLKAYQKTVKQSGAGQHSKQQANPFSEKINQTMSSLNLTHKKMVEEEAIKILNIDPKEINPNSILDAYYRMYQKNSVKNGGSFYIQSKIFNAKELLIEQFPGAEEEYKKEKENNSEENSENKEESKEKSEKSEKEEKTEKKVDESKEKKDKQ
ncbi:hypothetical protein PPERSA_06106 [Pseudocohnilembus persalinus]|uniref:Mitochondrial import inner membrane translocase subunit TIM16 n=1 Tax=Pseudocohnilembus persalinus TaxID=266149 RepID=A0A0V0QW41_PSEPJ|nr:hypothetical protein PPERSA_06106 [Pseudocohnilembus persalinus]|eukprot:KRX06224.1 hypothetical protein PPERSA_06106 [Pseudocohnilembus persalinus]